VCAPPANPGAAQRASASLNLPTLLGPARHKSPTTQPSALLAACVSPEGHRPVRIEHH